MEVNHWAGSHLHNMKRVVFGNCGSRDFCFVFPYCWWTGGLLSCLWCFWTALLAPLTCLWHFWTTLPVPRSLVVSLVKCLLYKNNDRTFQAAGHLGADRQDVSSLSRTYITRSRRFQPALRTSKTTSFNSADKIFFGMWNCLFLLISQGRFYAEDCEDWTGQTNRSISENLLEPLACRSGRGISMFTVISELKTRASEGLVVRSESERNAEAPKRLRHWFSALNDVNPSVTVPRHASHPSRRFASLRRWMKWGPALTGMVKKPNRVWKGYFAGFNGFFK